MNVNIKFCRALLSDVHKRVKEFDDTINLTKDAWVWHFHADHWEFHGPDEFYWYGRATNAYDARSQGWNAWLEAAEAKEVAR
jgi:hypothetical protein